MTARKPTIYLSNKMRGLQSFGFPWFDAARDRLSALGWEVVSPADIDRINGFDAMMLPLDTDWNAMPEGSETYEEIMLRDIEAMQNCDAIFLGPQWQDSPGACRELGQARILGLREFEESVCASPSPDVMREVRLSPLEINPPPFDFFADATNKMRDEIDAMLRSPRDAMPLAPIGGTDPRYTERGSVLDEANRLVCGDRNVAYGPPERDFATTAGMLTSLFGHMLKDGCAFKARDVAWIMMCVKASRSQHSPKRDNYVDAAGYAACGWECEVAEKAKEVPQ